MHSDHTTPTKKCYKCGGTKPIDEFNCNQSKADGLQAQCKSCSVEYREASRERRRETNRAWREANPERSAELWARARAKYPQRRVARSAVSNAVKYGKLPPASDFTCACGAQATEYHHDSYQEEHWLDVIAVCRACHVELHNGGDE